MFGSTMLEVAIGVMFVYLLLSLLCSALGELIESFARFRSRDLEKGIKNLLDHPALVKEFFNHPLIKPLGKNPSYIPARTFSLALWSLATSATAKGKQAAAGLTQNLDLIKEVIATLDDEKHQPIRTSLLTLIDEAGNNANRARANIEEWYNDAMDRVSGWYRRRMQWMLIVIGLSASAALNIDTIALTRTLWYSETLRSSVSIAAENYLKAQPAPVRTAADQESAAPTAIVSKPGLPGPGDSQPVKPEGASAAPQPSSRSHNALEKINDIRGEIDRLDLPIGWISAPRITDQKYEGLKEPELSEQYRQDLEAYKVDRRRAPQDVNGWLLKILGIFLTALAVSQGAPFWFDLLNKFVVIRSTVKPREKSQEQASKDKPAPGTADQPRAETASDEPEPSTDRRKSSEG